MMNKISVIINTYNEGKNIRNCLESVKWADEIVLVDMHSEDDTVMIAKEYHAKIYFFEKTGFVEPARSYALSKATNEWVLVLDADEMIPIQLKKALLSYIKDYDAVYIGKTNYIFGRKMLATGWGAAKHLQPHFFKKSFMKHTSKIHTFGEISSDARKMYLRDEGLTIVHFNYTDPEQFLEKMNRYTSIEATQYYNDKENIDMGFVAKKLIRDLRNRISLKDGLIGVSLTVLMFTYHVCTFLKLFLMKEWNDVNIRQKVHEQYNEIAASMLAEYQE